MNKKKIVIAIIIVVAALVLVGLAATYLPSLTDILQNVHQIPQH